MTNSLLILVKLHKVLMKAGQGNKKANLKMIKVIELEDYTRRENLKFHNIPESEEQGVNHSPKQVRVFI